MLTERELIEAVCRLQDDNTRLRFALLEVERHCPCGARPESLNTHPHVTGCPVGNALYPRLIDGSVVSSGEGGH